MHKKHISLKTISLFFFCLWLVPTQSLAVNSLRHTDHLVKRHTAYLATRTLSKKNHLTTKRAMSFISHRWRTLPSLTMPHTTGLLNSDIRCFNGHNSHINHLEDQNVEEANEFLAALEEMLEKAKVHLEVAEGQSCIVFMGTTGVGKSLLVNAIYHGSDTIEAVKKDYVKYSFSSPSGGDVHLRPTKEVERNGEILFKTGAGNTSVTLFPEAAELDGQVVVDCPGFVDTAGGKGDLVNCIVISKILRKASRVRLCFLLSQDQIMNTTGRQTATKELLKVLFHLFTLNNIPGIRSNDLKRIQIVVTHLEGNTRKGDLQNKLAETIDELLEGEKFEAITQLVEHILLVDPADRTSQFKEEKRLWWEFWRWFWTSNNDQTKVATLKSKLFEVEDKAWFLPSEFASPMTKKAIDILIKMCQAIQVVALTAIDSDDQDYEEKLSKLLDTLKKLQEYQFEGIEVNHYIEAINRALAAKKKGEDREKTINELKQRIEVLEGELNKRAEKKGIFEATLAKLGKGIDKVKAFFF